MNEAVCTVKLIPCIGKRHTLDFCIKRHEVRAKNIARQNSDSSKRKKFPLLRADERQACRGARNDDNCSRGMSLFIGGKCRECAFGM